MSQIVVRCMEFDLPQGDPYWLGNSPFKTHFFNSLTLLFPEAEQLAIRYFKKSLGPVQEPRLHAQMVGFIGQEGQHAAAHTKFWAMLRQQGYELDRVTRILQIFISKKQRFSTAFYLATIAGFEHFTDCLAEFVLTTDYLATAAPDLRALFEWHFAEELEHKTVAYDLLQQVSNSYLLRIVGLINAHLAILGATSLGCIALLAQDKQLWRFKTWRDAVQLLVLEKFGFRVATNFLAYWNPGFHPAQRDSTALCQAVFARYGLHP